MNAHEHKKQFIKDNTIQSDAGASLIGIKDRNNCVVRAVSIAYGIPYKIVDKIAEKTGRKPNKGFWIVRMVIGMKMEGYEDFEIIIPRKGLTLYSFLKEYPKGRYLIEISKHAFAVIDGKIYDIYLNKPLSRIDTIHKVRNYRTEFLIELFGKAVKEFKGFRTK
jgi:hypothetical protein